MEEDDAYIVVNSIIENYTPTVLKGIDMILESNLTDYQKKVAQQIYIYSKEYVATILHKDTDNTVKIIEMVCHIMKQVESIDKTTGNDKKIIVIEICGIFIKELLCDILVLYQTLIDPIIENMVDISKNVNIEYAVDQTVNPVNPVDPVNRNIFKKICPRIITFFKLRKISRFS